MALSSYKNTALLLSPLIYKQHKIKPKSRVDNHTMSKRCTYIALYCKSKLAIQQKDKNGYVLCTVPSSGKLQGEPHHIAGPIDKNLSFSALEFKV